MLAGHITIDDCATIGGGAGINQFSRIGRCSYIGGLARITKAVPPYMIVEGTPAEVRAVNIVAMSRRGYPEDQIDAMKEAYKRLFRDNGGSLFEKMAQLLEEFPDQLPVQHLCDAISASAAGRHGRSNEKVAK
jgi:UDP-N-acetylglucosamine acyltransferase